MKWIISDIKRGENNNEILAVEFKPLNAAPYCKEAFERCNKVLIMSATISDPDQFCKNVGLKREEVEFIAAPSDFPKENRPIYVCNTAKLDWRSLQLVDIQIKIATKVDELMTKYKDHKGIIHTTSYKQSNFIPEKISAKNVARLIETTNNSSLNSRTREQVIAEHVNSVNPTVLISPSLNTGLELNDELSRFQIIVKVPYPDLSDRWIKAKKDSDQSWYVWQTVLELEQAYGRSVRSKEDYADTYILDSGFLYFFSKNRGMFADWFVEALR
jgi:ATP-dependent DNA helicase DinG